MSARVVFRADGNPAIGGGHIMRSLALASVFADNGWQVGFASRAESFKAMPPLGASGFDMFSLPDDPASEAAAMAARWPGGCDLLVVDHYERDASLEHACRPWTKRILVIDDLADRAHDADVLVDSGATVSAVYEKLVPASCRVLTGAKYAVLHPAFLLAREAALSRRDGRAVSRILVSLGQMDPDNATALALDAIEISGFSGAVDVVLGRSAPHLAAIRRRAKHRVNLHVNISNMHALMATSDLAIGAGGVSGFERCCVGLPSLLLQIAANQINVIRTIAGAGAGIDCGLAAGIQADSLARQLSETLEDAERRQKMAAAGSALVDGRGALRILLASIGEEKSKDGRSVFARLAEPKDEQWLLDLQSVPQTRQYANNPSVPSAEEHGGWFTRVVKDPFRLLMIVEINGIPAGMLRLDRRPDDDLVSVAVSPEYHGNGIGRAALRLASRFAPSRMLSAQVHSENSASLALFLSEGYQLDSGNTYRREPQ